MAKQLSVEQLEEPRWVVSPMVGNTIEEMNSPAATRGGSFSGQARHSVLDTESSRAFWIPAGVYPGENRGRYDELAASREE